MLEANGGTLGLRSGAQSTDSIADVGARRELGRALARLFTFWNIPESQQAQLLDVSPTTIARVLSGGDPVPLGEPLDRAGYLFGLYLLLAELFPENPELRSSWVRRKNRALSDVSPLEVMARGGLAGVKRVLQLAEHQAYE